MDHSQYPEDVYNMEVADLEPDVEDSGAQFTGSTVATATITPKPRKRRSDAMSGKDVLSSRKDSPEERFVDPDQYERERRTDPTLIHSPEEWSSEFAVHLACPS